MLRCARRIETLAEEELIQEEEDRPEDEPEEVVVAWRKKFTRKCRRLVQGSTSGVYVLKVGDDFLTDKGLVDEELGQYWEGVFPQTQPYSVYVPSFGLWGFNLAVKNGEFNLAKTFQNELNHFTICKIFFLTLKII